MNKPFIDINDLAFGDDGRVELSTAELRSIEACFEIVAGGSTTNMDDCSGTTNDGCTNNLKCNDSTNTGCTNKLFRCKGATEEE